MLAQPISVGHADLTCALTALGHPVRLELVRQLRSPRRSKDLRVSRAGRPLARQSLDFHLRILLDAGLVVRLDATGPKESRFVADPSRLAAVATGLARFGRAAPE